MSVHRNEKGPFFLEIAGVYPGMRIIQEFPDFRILDEINFDNFRDLPRSDEKII